MLNNLEKDAGTGGGVLAHWRQPLETVGLLSPGLKEAYRGRLEDFEQFCGKRAGSQDRAAGGESAPRATVGLAREYVDLQRLERAPGPAQLQEWKEAGAGTGVCPASGCPKAWSGNGPSRAWPGNGSGSGGRGN